MTAPTDDTTKVTVRGLTMASWKCHRPTTVVVGMHLATVVNGDLVTCDDEQALATAAELLRATGHVGLASRSRPAPAGPPAPPS